MAVGAPNRFQELRRPCDCADRRCFPARAVARTPEGRQDGRHSHGAVLSRHDPVRPQDGEHAKDPTRGPRQLLEKTPTQGERTGLANRDGPDAACGFCPVREEAQRTAQKHGPPRLPRQRPLQRFRLLRSDCQKQHFLPDFHDHRTDELCLDRCGSRCPAQNQYGRAECGADSYRAPVLSGLHAGNCHPLLCVPPEAGLLEGLLVRLRWGLGRFDDRRGLDAAIGHVHSRRGQQRCARGQRADDLANCAAPATHQAGSHRAAPPGGAGGGDAAQGNRCSDSVGVLHSLAAVGSPLCFRRCLQDASEGGFRIPPGPFPHGAGNDVGAPAERHLPRQPFCGLE
mmetsp:Transcript_3437/g.8180  ORF Transcript_3437/g.8180 Transcript_3437/m.8180 type:complete len:341 (-) Transcript_3437:753-1775(-)